MNEAETRADFKICHFDRREKSHDQRTLLLHIPIDEQE